MIYITPKCVYRKNVQEDADAPISHIRSHRSVLTPNYSTIRTRYTTCILLYRVSLNRPVEGGGGESFPGPRDVCGPRRRSKILKMVFQVASFWPKICIKSATFGRGSAPDPDGGSYDAPRTPSRMVRGHLSPRFLPLDGVSISRHTEWEGGAGPAMKFSRAPLWLSTGLSLRNNPTCDLEL